jgi:hypothetical protein
MDTAAVPYFAMAIFSAVLLRLGTYAKPSIVAPFVLLFK